jgi:translation initiation factor eIF-2B subunit delta
MLYRNILRLIKEDKTSGASSLYEKALHAFKLFFEELKTDSKNELISRFTELGKDLIEAQPSMAPMINLVNEIALLLESDEGDLKNDVLEFIDKKERNLKEHREKIKKVCEPLLHEKLTLMTHSYSSSVYEILKRAKDTGKEIEVYCTQSPPAFEGKMLAYKLMHLGIRVTLIEDHTAPFFAKEVDIILVGADAILKRGFINKTGTFPLALSSEFFEIPFYVVSTTDKFLSPLLEPFLRIKFEIEKVSNDLSPHQIKFIRPIFDFTPWNLVKNIITEEGIKDANEVIDILNSLPVSHILEKISKEKGGIYES